MKYLLIAFSVVILSFSGLAQNYYFPPLSGNEWDTVSPESLGWCTEEIDTLLEYLEDNNTKAFIVLQDGKIALEQYFGTFVQDSIWYWASAGKTLTAFLTGMAQEQGSLSINDVTAEFLGTGWTNCPPDKEELITVWHQLTMTSGLDDGVPDPYCTLDTCLQYLADAGTRWGYHNAPYTLLESVVEEATGQNYNAFLYSQVNSRTGMNGIFLPSGFNNVYYSNARSMARFGLLILNGGIWENDTIMTDTAYFNDMVTTSQSLNLSYGYLWWLNGKESFMLPGLQYVFPGPLFPDAPADMFAALGKNGQVINVVPSLGLVFIRMGNSPEGSGEITPIFNNNIWQLLNNIMCNLTGDVEVTRPVKSGTILFPNPGKDIFNIILEPQPDHYFIHVYDLFGNLLLSGENLSEFQTSGWKNGIYLVHVSVGGDVINLKLIKN
jgi:CubicO group peptidase (beta-lactamase class C family)